MRLKDLQQRYPNLDQLTGDQAVALREELRNAIQWKGAGYDDPTNQARLLIYYELNGAMIR